jgi:hypothetical protein
MMPKKVMQTGFKRILANILQNTVKRGPLVHVNDVWQIAYYYEAIEIDIRVLQNKHVSIS